MIKKQHPSAHTLFTQEKLTKIANTENVRVVKKAPIIFSVLTYPQA